MRAFDLPTGQLSRRIHGAKREMRERAESARSIAREMKQDQSAAALRGKARGYDEAADLLDAIDRGRRLPKRWGRRTARPAGSSDAAELNRDEIGYEGDGE